MHDISDRIFSGHICIFYSDEKILCRCDNTHSNNVIIKEYFINTNKLILPRSFLYAHNQTHSCVISKAYSTNTKLSNISMWSSTKTASIIEFSKMFWLFTDTCFVCKETVHNSFLFNFKRCFCHTIRIIMIIKRQL